MIIKHTIVTYKKKEYAVCVVNKNDTEIPFIIDEKNLEKVLAVKNWYCVLSGGYGYIATNDKGTVIYLHNFIMDFTPTGKGSTETVDHVNRIGLDNREKNLRIITQSEQNKNQKKKKRNIELPEDCGIDPDDVPTYIWYEKPYKNHGDRFCVEIKEYPDLDFKSSSSKDFSLRAKLEFAKKYLNELIRTKPEIFKDRCMNGELSSKGKRRLKSYNKILALSDYDCIDDFLVDIKDREIFQNYLKPMLDDLTEKEITYMNDVVTLDHDSNKKRFSGKSNLPPDCGVKPEEVPKYCRYREAKEGRGDSFLIERHPTLLQNGKRQLATSESALISTLDKFKELMEYMQSLDDGEVPEKKARVRAPNKKIKIV